MVMIFQEEGKFFWMVFKNTPIKLGVEKRKSLIFYSWLSQHHHGRFFGGGLTQQKGNALAHITTIHDHADGAMSEQKFAIFR